MMAEPSTHAERKATTMSPADISNLASQVKGLETWFDRSQWLYIILVALTVVATFWSYRLGVKLKRTQDLLSNAKELALGSNLDEKEKKIKEINDQAEKDRQASALEIAKLKTEAEKQKAVVATAEANAATAGKQAAEANRAAETERLERLKLESQIAPRRLSNDQRRSLFEACKPFVGQHIEVSTYALDVESAILGKQIVSALQGVLTVEDRIASQQPIGSFVIGVHVYGSDPKLVATITKSLRDVGGLDVFNDPPPPFTGMSAGGISSAPVSILIGPKPIK